MVRVEEGREFLFRSDLYSQESTFPLVACVSVVNAIRRRMKVESCELRL